MRGWSSHLGGDSWDDEPAWLYEITWEWEQLPAQRHPGDPERRRRAVHIPVYEASRGADVHGVGIAHVVPRPPPWSSPDDRQVPSSDRRPDGAGPDQPPPAPRHGTVPTPRQRGPAPFEQTRPVPQEVRPQFRQAPPPMQDMPAPFYGSTQPTLRDARPRANGNPVQSLEGRPAGRPTPYLPGPDQQPGYRGVHPVSPPEPWLSPHDREPAPAAAPGTESLMPFGWDHPDADSATTLAGPHTTMAGPGAPRFDPMAEPPAVRAEAETGHQNELYGMGWRLKSLGLGAVTTGPRSEPTPDERDDPDRTDVLDLLDAATPVNGTAPARHDWFSPMTGNRPKAPEPEPAAEAVAEPPMADEAESGSEPNPGGVAEPGEDARPAPQEATEPKVETSNAAPRSDPRRRLADPEQVLLAYPWRFSPQTMREVIGEPDQLIAIRDRLTDKLEYAERDAVRARLLSLRAVVSRVLGDLDFALADAQEALEHAEATGELRRISIVQARLANVLRWRGEFAEADRLFEEADSVELPTRLRAEIAELAGRSAFDQGRYLESMNRFAQALDLRRGGDEELVARIELALDLVAEHGRKKGWGPYPRTSAEIRQRWEPETLATGEHFAEVQAFHEQTAWVRRPDAQAWELVDARRELVIGCAEGYLQVRPFTEGLAWVSRDPVGGWFAIDHENRVIVPGGFDDVLPFRHGVAPVRQGWGWGAVDRYARLVVQTKYRRFATALAGGHPIDGFTREGLAVIDVGDRYGVIDRSGRLRVAPVHAGLVIHPVAYLIRDTAGRWGALNRDGDPLVDMTYRSEADVAEAVDHLLADTRPLL